MEALGLWTMVQTLSSYPFLSQKARPTNPVSPPFHLLDSLSVLPSTQSANHKAELGASTLLLLLCSGNG